MPHTPDIAQLIEAIGYLGVVAILFAETGLLVGLALPGDSLLLAAGVLAAQNALELWLLVPLCMAAAIAGNAVGYGMGQRWGRPLLEREQVRFAFRRRLEEIENLMAHHGGLAVIVARFVPFMRTVMPVVAGMSTMRFGRFMVFNVIGAFLWTGGLLLAGYYLGQLLPDLHRYLTIGMVSLAFVATVIFLVRLLNQRRHRD